MTVFHGTSMKCRPSIIACGLEAGSCVTTRRDLAETYAGYAVVRHGLPASRGLLAVAAVDPADLAPDPNSEPGEESFRLRRRIRPRLIPIALHSDAVAEVEGFA
jgi:hypothetical protein